MLALVPPVTLQKSPALVERLCKGRGGEEWFGQDQEWQDRGGEDGSVCEPLDTYRIRTIRRLHAGAVEQEANRRKVSALTIAKGIHEFRESGGPLDLEEDLIVAVGNFNV